MLGRKIFMTIENLSHVLPLSTDSTDQGILRIGGCDLRSLANQYGTPLYIYDVQSIKELALNWVEAFSDAYPDSEILYASKAYISRPFARLLSELDLSFDAVSEGEIEVLSAANINLSRVYFHGSNKTPQEIYRAMQLGVGRIVLDGFDEIDTVSQIARDLEVTQPVLLRVSPGVDAHTHQKTTTGILDSKFGLPIETGLAELAISKILETSNLEFRGLHMHLGSPIFDLEPYRLGIEVLAEFIDEVCIKKLGTSVKEFSPGGGFATAYRSTDDPPLPQEYAEIICGTLIREAKKRDFPLPHITLEPGRSIAARSGVAVYTVGNRKEIPEIRTYVSVDGGMSDNIRPALYDSVYEVIAAERINDPIEERVTIAGKYCESGDLLAKDVDVPRLVRGELIAIPSSGAYQLAMSSNYNLAYRPAAILVENGTSRLMQRRENAEDLMRLDID